MGERTVAANEDVELIALVDRALDAYEKLDKLDDEQTALLGEVEAFRIPASIKTIQPGEYRIVSETGQAFVQEIVRSDDGSHRVYMQPVADCDRYYELKDKIASQHKIYTQLLGQIFSKRPSTLVGAQAMARIAALYIEPGHIERGRKGELDALGAVVIDALSALGRGIELA